MLGIKLVFASVKLISLFKWLDERLKTGFQDYENTTKGQYNKKQGENEENI